jgi:hypothetical protein
LKSYSKGVGGSVLIIRRSFLAVVAVLLSLPARAGEIAVLDFDSHGLNYDDAALVAQGFRDAFLEQGTFFPLEGYDITDRLSAGHESDVSLARKKVADARVLLNEGRAREAVGLLEEAEQLHKKAGSAHARRAQIADVYFFKGQAELRLGRSSAANTSFVQMLSAYPGYGERRAGSVTSSVKASMERAKATRASQGRDLMEADTSNVLARKLRVNAVVVGVVEASGQLHVRLTLDGRIDGEIRRKLESVPPFPGDPVYTQMVRDLTANLDASNSGFTPAREFDSVPSTRFESPPGFEAPATGGDTVARSTTDRAQPKDDSPGLPDSIGKDRRPWWQFWSREKAPVTGRINVAGRLGPITQEWWFWAATGTVVAGGTTAAVVLLSNGQEDPEPGPVSTSYTLSIEVE